MKNFIVLCLLFFAGCSPQLTLENQVQNKMVVTRVFINNPQCITVMYETDAGSLTSTNLYSANRIEFVESDDGMYVTWNTYPTTGNYASYDMVVHLPDLSAIEAGENNKGKFGRDKLHDVGEK